jgi:hypothetical protein
MIDVLVMLVLVADSTTVRGAVISVEASSAMALPAPVRANIAIAAAPITVLVIGLRWSWFVGQIGGVVKVYSGV